MDHRVKPGGDGLEGLCCMVMAGVINAESLLGSLPGLTRQSTLSIAKWTLGLDRVIDKARDIIVFNLDQPQIAIVSELAIDISVGVLIA